MLYSPSTQSKVIRRTGYKHTPIYKITKEATSTRNHNIGSIALVWDSGEIDGRIKNVQKNLRLPHDSYKSDIYLIKVIFIELNNTFSHNLI